MFSKFKKRMLIGLIAFLMTACFVAPSFAVQIIRGDRAFAGKVTFLQDVLATKNATVEGTLNANAYSEVFLVHSGTGSDVPHYGKSYDKPFATLDYAIGRCTASRGNTIYLLPGHAEAEATAASIATMDVAGVYVVGVGTGTLMPTFSLSDDEATFTMSAADCILSGVRIYSTVADVAVGVTMAATSDGSVVQNCVFRDSADDEELLVGVSVAAAAVGNKILYNDFKTTASGGSANAILSAANTDLQVIGNTAFGAYSTGAMLTSGVLTQATIKDNIFVNSAAIGIALNGTTSTGILARNLLGGTTSMAAALTGEDAMVVFENYVTGDVAASGVLDPGVDTE